jgi:hypothetical protein
MYYLEGKLTCQLQYDIYSLSYAVYLHLLDLYSGEVYQPGYLCFCLNIKFIFS